MHRDLKPSNILVGKTIRPNLSLINEQQVNTDIKEIHDSKSLFEVRIADFGLARYMNSESGDYTHQVASR